MASVMARSKHRARRQRKAVFFPLALLAVLVLALFAPTLKSGFAYDSIEQIGAGDFIHDRENLLPTLTFRVMTLDVLDFNRPVALLSFMLDAVVWDRDPFGFHLTNILLHLTGTCLVFLLARHILARGSPPGEDAVRQTLASFLAAALFAVHPLVTEAVCEPSNRKDLLALVFGLAVVLIAARHNRLQRGDLLRLFLIGLLSLLSVGSKESGVAFPVVLILYWFLFRRDERRGFWLRAIVSSAGPVLVFAVARFAFEHRVSAVFISKPTYPGGSFLNVLTDQPRIYLLDLVNTFWPAHLCADYGLYSVRDLPLVLALPVLALIGAGLFWWGKRDPRVAFAVGVMVAGILPASNLLPQYHPAADRYLYIPLAGAALLASIALDRLPLFRRYDRRWIAVLPVLALIGLLSWVTLGREAVWASPLALAEDTMAANPESDMAWRSLPQNLMDAGRLEESRSWYERAFHTPVGGNPWLWVGYALLLDRLGEHAQALSAANRAVAIKPDLVDTDKMVVTLQSDRDMAERFARLVASGHARP